MEYSASRRNLAICDRILGSVVRPCLGTGGGALVALAYLLVSFALLLLGVLGTVEVFGPWTFNRVALTGCPNIALPGAGHQAG